MIFLYNTALSFYKTIIQIAAFFGNEKAKLWVNGRKNIFNHIEQVIQKHPLSNHRVLWMHVASLGEFEQGRPIIEGLKKGQKAKSKRQGARGKEQEAKGNNQSAIINNQYTIILTFFSPSGYEIRKNYAFADHVFYLPLDSAAHAQQFLDLVKPDLAIFVKYEFWYHYLTELHRRHIPTLLVSAIFRDKQFASFNPYTPILIRVLKTFRHIFVQDTPSVYLLKKHGLTAVTQAGDTRIDRVLSIAQEAQPFPLIAQFVGDAPVFIGGSTWQPDEALIITLLADVRFKNWRFIFAPHDISPKNIDRLEKSLPEPCLRYSALGRGSWVVGHESQPTSHDSRLSTHDPRLLIIDNVGMLSALYRYGRIAYIGGGFGSGIHNTLEPIAFGLPVIFGTKYKKFAEAVHLVETGGGFTVRDAETLKTVINNLLSEKNYTAAAAAAKNYIENNKGATNKIIDFLKI